MKVGDIILISDGNGGTKYAKLTDVDSYWVHFTTRKSARGRWSTAVSSMTRRKFKEARTAAEAA